MLIANIIALIILCLVLTAYIIVLCVLIKKTKRNIKRSEATIKSLDNTIAKIENLEEIVEQKRINEWQNIKRRMAKRFKKSHPHYERDNN